MKKKFTYVLLAAFIILSTNVSFASFRSDKLDLGLKVGETIPDIPVTNIDKSQNKLIDFTGEKGLILLFSRSMDWCPFCQTQAIEWNKRKDDFTSLGYNIVLVTYDPIETLEKFSVKNDIQYRLVSDYGSNMIKAFGILNEEMKKGTRFYGVPKPIIYVLNSSGEILHRFSEEDYKLRPEIDTVLQSILPVETQTPKH
jgi:peroxiredoxin